MKSNHRIFFESAHRMKPLANGSVALMVTSPPYPMIAMWDELFQRQNPAIEEVLRQGKGMEAFELMHRLLDPVWRETYRVLTPGGIACINIGDATRTLTDDFILYPNHARILNEMVKIGFTPLPEILWRKQTNAPNKFMGSGMMPPGAYVTLEHEHILILRKGAKREFPTDADKRNRRESAFFWEERNHWYSDVWMDLKGTPQKLTENDARLRSAAFPFEVPYRLITMFSVKADLILDPFLGTGSSTAAAIAAGRNSVGFELFEEFLPVIDSRLDSLPAFANERIDNRLKAHIDFVTERVEAKGPMSHRNGPYGFPVITSQETQLIINALERVQKVNATTIEATYSDTPQPDFVREWEGATLEISEGGPGRPKGGRKQKAPKSSKPVQRKLLDF